MIISVSGTPGTGKTFIAKKLSKTTSGRMEYFDLNRYIKDNKLYDSYDRKAKTFDVDIEHVKSSIDAILKANMSRNKILNSMVGETFDIDSFLKKFPKNIKDMDGIIVDSHLSHYFESDYCIIVRSGIKNVSARLERRGYSKSKIKDNVESEIFGICLEEAKALKRRIIIVNN